MADAALVVRTGALAFRPASRLDERQVSARDRAYRLGFRIVGLSLVGWLLLQLTPIWIIWSGPSVDSGDTVFDGTRPSLVVAILEMFVILPTMVLAWQEPGEPKVAGRARLIGLAAPILAGAAVAVGWTMLVTAAAPRSLSNVGAPDSGLHVEGAQCAHVLAVRDAALGLGGVVRLRAEVCWNGRVAFIFGAGSGVAIPPGAPPDLTRTSLPDRMSCGPDLDQQDMVRISRATCSAVVDGDGTLHYRASGHVFPTPLTIGGRDVVLELTATADGHIVVSD